MAKKKVLTKEQGISLSWQMSLGLSALLFLVAYGFVSWAIDSGNLLHYALAILFLVLAIREIKRGVQAFRHK